MFTGTSSHPGGLVTAIVVLTATAILHGGGAVADSNQDDQFLAQLDNEGIPALDGVPSLIDTAHNVCRILDAGMPADDLVDAMVNNAYGIDPKERRYAPGRLARTEARFISAAVEVYCPYDHSKIASIMANPAPGWNEPTDRVGAVRLPHLMDGGVLLAGRYRDDRSDCDAHGPVLASLIGAVPSGDITQPDPPQIPAPPPPAQLRIPHPPMAAPPPPQQPPPPPHQPPPPPHQVQPPAVGPQPGGAGGSDGTGGIGDGTGGIGGGTGGAGGNGPAEPSPTPPMPPGFVRLAP
jgi:hypothetical protein